MIPVLAACRPESDAGFAERVRHILSQDRWDLGSPEGIAAVQAVLRGTYPVATVAVHGGVSAGGVRRTVVLDVYRDGLPGPRHSAALWTEALYDLSGPSAYRAAARILGPGREAERIVERAFREVRGSVSNALSLEAAGALVEAAAGRLAIDAEADRQPTGPEETTSSAVPALGLAHQSIRSGPVRRTLSPKALTTLLSNERAALELAVLEDLKANEIAERMQTTSAAVHRHLRDALLAVGSGAPPSAPATLARWREARRGWELLPATHGARAERARAVADAWLDYQVATRSLPPDTVVLVTDAARRFVTTSGNAGALLGRPSAVGLRIDDITPTYARPFLPELWGVFDASGSMDGVYDCERPAMTPLPVPFQGVWGRPLPELQVGYLRPAKLAMPGESE